MPDQRVRVIRHVADGIIPASGSFEVRVDGVTVKYIYFDDDKTRRSIRMGDILDQETAKKKAIELARREREKLG